MSNLKAQYETAQTALWAINDKLNEEGLSDADWSRCSHEYAAQKVKVAKLHKARQHECSKAAYARSLAVAA